MENKQLLRLRRLSDVPRWTIIPTIRRQNTAEHSFHVACMALWLADRHQRVHDGSISKGDVLQYAIEHDEYEAISGDIPSTFKRQIRDVYGSMELEIKCDPVNPTVANIIKCADYLEALTFLREEMAMGNQRCSAIWTDVQEAFIPHWEQFEWGPLNHDKPSWSGIIMRVTKILNPTSHPGLIA